MWKSTPEGIILSVRVIPNAKHDEIAGWEHGFLKVRITSVPEKGKANRRLIQFFSKSFKIPKSKISVVKGKTHRNKIFLFKGVENLPLPPFDSEGT